MEYISVTEFASKHGISERTASKKKVRKITPLLAVLRDTCLTAQDNYKSLLDYYRIKY